MKEQPYIYKTDYLHTVRTWVIRAFLFLIFATVLRNLPFETADYWIRNLLTVVLLILFIVVPRQDMGIDKDRIYFFDASLVPFLSKVKSYKLSDIESIRVAGVHNKTTEILDGMAPGNSGGIFNYLEINFRDDTCESYRLNVYKKDLNKIVQIARERNDSFSHQP
ncbi:hypothetical protein [Maribellus sediminis]|uniref:hypothetical protein n=1 Tax=Maribellus sediminis TaxID=2696285 RepID=UPI001431A9B7|nr:hypothetical protein [Maribellus sediminis]